MRNMIGIALTCLFFQSYAYALTPHELKALTESVKEMCLFPDRAADYLKIEGNAKAGLPIPVKIVKGELSGKIAYETWKGIPITLDKYKTDPRQCAQEMLKTLLPVFEKGKSSEGKKVTTKPKLAQFALNLSKSSFRETIEPKFGAGKKIRTFAIDPAFLGVLKNYRAIFSVSMENTSDSDLLITRATYNVSELGQVMGGAPGPLETNQTYFHKLKYAVGRQQFDMVPPYKIPPKSVGAFELEVTTDATDPGLCWITNITFNTNHGAVSTKPFQLILTGKK